MALDYSIIGERIRKARLENNITQEKLAEELDVSIAFVSRIECGTTHINLKRLSQICNILNCTLEDLLDEKYDEVAVIGDAVAPRKILTAIHEGYHAIRVME